MQTSQPLSWTALVILLIRGNQVPRRVRGNLDMHLATLHFAPSWAGRTSASGPGCPPDRPQRPHTRPIFD
eukprot:scaffold371306_cov15-Prasinocladus_malaysianus.AAC.1